MNRDDIKKLGRIGAFFAWLYAQHLITFAFGVAAGTIQTIIILTQLYEAGVLKP
jgi:hypothetical protein